MVAETSGAEGRWAKPLSRPNLVLRRPPWPLWPGRAGVRWRIKHDSCHEITAANIL